jgi:hypothetical protein
MVSKTTRKPGFLGDTTWNLLTERIKVRAFNIAFRPMVTCGAELRADATNMKIIGNR